MRTTYIYIWTIFQICLGTALNSANAQWVAMPDGPNHGVRALCYDSTNARLYAFGRFTEAGGQVVNGTAFLENSLWHPMGEGVDNVFVWPVMDAHLHHDSVMISGAFESLIGIPDTKRIALWNGSQWTSIGGIGANGNAGGMMTNEDGWTVVGGFTEIGGMPSHGIARYRNGEWEDLCQYPDNSGWRIYNAVAKYQGNYIVGGNVNDFPGINEVGVLENDSLRPMGPGIVGDPWVNDMVVYDGKLFVAGEFYADWGNPGSGIMTWDGMQWANPIPGVQCTVQAFDLDVYDGKLFFSSYMILPGSTDAYTLAMYTPGRICLFGKNLTAAMNTIAGVPGGLFVAPNFPDLVVGGEALGWIAYYDLTQGFDTCLALPVGIDDLHRNMSDIVLYPNPNDGQFQVRLPDGFTVQTVAVHDAVGRQVKLKPYSFDRALPGLALEVMDAASGFYAVRICSTDARCLIGRMVVR